MIDYNKKFYDLQETMKERVPDFKIKLKEDSSFMKLLGKILFFNKKFMTTYTTTIGKTIYFPNKHTYKQYPGAYMYTLAHEYVHIMDYVKHPVLFTFGYLFPQILAILAPLSLLFFINPLFLLFLFTLLFLAPIPAPFRTKAELKGYGMSCKVRIWSGEDVSYVQQTSDNYISSFTNSMYYFMWPFKKYVTKKLLKYTESDDCLSDPTFMDVYNVIKK